MTLDLAYELERRGVPAGAVHFPGASTPPLEGALSLLDTGAGVELATVDYGTRALLGRFPTQEEGARQLLAYLDRPLPSPLQLSADALADAEAASASHWAELEQRLASGDRLLIHLPAGVLVDRIGALDGIHVFPSGTPVERRALPPTALGGSAQRWILRTYAPLAVRVLLAAPWFGQPGGGIRCTLADDFVGIRDLVASGALARIEVGAFPAAQAATSSLIRQSEILAEIAGRLVGDRDGEWQTITLSASATAGVINMKQRIVVSDAIIGPRLPEGLFDLIDELRALMYRPGVGTWFEMQMVIPHAGKTQTRFNYDEEPSNVPPFSPGAYALDQRKFPRDIEHQPAWLQRKIADGLIEIGES